MFIIAHIVNALFDLYFWVIVISVIASWLVAFGIVNRSNQIVDAILRTTYSLTEPVMRPVRNFLPNLGGIDISPIIVIILLRAVQRGLNHYIFIPAINQGM